MNQNEISSILKLFSCAQLVPYLLNQCLFFVAAGPPPWCGPDAGAAPASLSGPLAGWADSVLAAADSYAQLAVPCLHTL